MSDILEEVLRDYSDEKKLYYFKKILPVVLSFTVIIIAFMLYNNWYKDRKLSEQMQLSDKFLKILARNPEIDTNAYSDLSDISLQTESNVTKLANLKQIDIQIKDRNYKQAKILLEKIIFDENQDEMTKSYAYMSWLGLIIDKDEFVAEDQDKFKQTLSSFGNDGQVFEGTICLMRAIWYVKNNEKDKAIEFLKKITSVESASGSTKEQAKILLSNLQ